MRKKILLIILLCLVLVIALLAGYIAYNVYRFNVNQQFLNSENSNYPCSYMQTINYYYLKIPKGEHSDCNWKVHQDGDVALYVTEYQLKESSIFIFEALEKGIYNVNIRLEKNEISSYCTLKLNFEADEDKILSLLNLKEINTGESLSGGDDTAMPFTFVAQEDKSLKLYLNCTIKDSYFWQAGADEGVTIHGPITDLEKAVYVFDMDAPGTYKAFVKGKEVGLCLNFTIVLEEYDYPRVSVWNLSDYDGSDMESVKGIEEFSAQFPKFSLPQGFDVGYYSLSNVADHEKGISTDYIQGNLEFEDNYTLSVAKKEALNTYLSDTASVLEVKSTEKETAGKIINLFTGSEVLCAVWENGDFCYRLEHEFANEKSSEEKFLNTIAEIIKAN